MLFSEAKGQKVVSKSTAETVGKVADFVLDPRSRRIAALVLKTSGDSDTLPWADIASFGDDAVVVDHEAVIVDLTGDLVELSDKRHAASGKRVLTTEGAELGDVRDIDFDPQTGAIAGLILKDDTVDGIRLLAVGSYAVIVQS